MSRVEGVSVSESSRVWISLSSLEEIEREFKKYLISKNGYSVSEAIGSLRSAGQQLDMLRVAGYGVSAGQGKRTNRIMPGGGL
jgi:ribosomal protein S13